MGCCTSDENRQPKINTKSETQQKRIKQQRTKQVAFLKSGAQKLWAPTKKISKINDLYTIFETIATSNFCKVVRARNIQNNQEVAIKSINKPKKFEHFESITKQVQQLKNLDNENIIRIYEVLESNKHIHIVMELCTGGTIQDRLIARHGLSEKQIASYMRQILQSLADIHGKGIFHKDIKPSNILLDSEFRNAKVKLVGFDLYNFNGKVKISDLQSKCVSYSAPEWLQDYEFTEKSDVWSCGVMLHQLLGQYHPFNDETSTQTIKNICKNDIDLDSIKWQKISDEAKDLISQLLNKNPAMRPNANQALLHPWFKILNWDEPIKRKTLLDLKPFAKGNLQKQNLYKYVTMSCMKNDEKSIRRAMTNVDDFDQICGQG